MRTTIITIAIVAMATLASVESARQDAGQTPRTVKEVMTTMMIPASDAIFAGSAEPPTAAEGWGAIRKQAVTLAESGKLLMTDALAKDKAKWMEMARALVQEAETVMKAADAKDRDALEQASDRVYATCEACHERYMAAN